MLRAFSYKGSFVIKKVHGKREAWDDCRRDSFLKGAVGYSKGQMHGKKGYKGEKDKKQRGIRERKIENFKDFKMKSKNIKKIPVFSKKALTSLPNSAIVTT